MLTRSSVIRTLKILLTVVIVLSAYVGYFSLKQINDDIWAPSINLWLTHYGIFIKSGDIIDGLIDLALPLTCVGAFVGGIALKTWRKAFSDFYSALTIPQLLATAIVLPLAVQAENQALRDFYRLHPDK